MRGALFSILIVAFFASCKPAAVSGDANTSGMIVQTIKLPKNPKVKTLPGGMMINGDRIGHMECDGNQNCHFVAAERGYLGREYKGRDNVWYVLNCDENECTATPKNP